MKSYEKLCKVMKIYTGVLNKIEDEDDFFGEDLVLVCCVAGTDFELCCVGGTDFAGGADFELCCVGGTDFAGGADFELCCVGGTDFAGGTESDLLTFAGGPSSWSSSSSAGIKKPGKA